MKRYVLDTSALLTLRDDEPGAERVAEVLHLAAKGKARCYGCFISLMEVLYRVWRDEDEASGRLAYQQCLALPVEWVRDSEALLLMAAELKALYPLSLADAWIAACARMHGAVLMHKDPELNALPIEQEALPLKAKRGKA
ncbi:MAG: PIN domain-containing protein [Nitrosomonadales bacterium]|nr:PIN domain-containing protein [Nitrosomonadales bacterium]